MAAQTKTKNQSMDVSDTVGYFKGPTKELINASKDNQKAD
jgi:hypothetical protein